MKPRHRWSVLIGAVATALVAFTALASTDRAQLTETCGKLLAPAQGMYFGAGPGFSGEDAVQLRSINAFDEATRHRAVWTYFGQWWSQSLRFPEGQVRLVWGAGKVPFIRLNPFPSQPGDEQVGTGISPGPFTLQDIAGGAYDRQLRAWADAARDTQIPILVEFGTEVNNYFPWSGRNNGGAKTTDYGDPAWPDGPERFRDAYRHIVAVFRAEGASNVTWFFHADTAYYWKPEAWNALKWYYPGDDDIDWLALSLYAAPIKPDGSVTSFDEKLQTFHEPGYVGSYTEIADLGTKPLALTEVGFNNVPDLHRRSVWVEDAAASMRAQRYPRLAAFSWYVVRGGEFDDRIDASPEFQAAFRASFGDPFFGALPHFSGNCLPRRPTNPKLRHGRFSWHGVPNAASYEVWRKRRRISTTTGTSVIVGRAIAGLHVRGVNMLGPGPFSLSPRT